jgi:hypothetical protein
MLEEEGIKFESDGMKIMNEHFVNNDEGTKVCAKKRKEKTKATKQSSTANNNKNAASKPTATAAVDEITVEMLKQEILQLLNKRAPGKTC